MSENRQPSCPSCLIGFLTEVGFNIKIGTILSRWESEADIRLSQDTLREYDPQTIIRLWRCTNCEFETFLPITPGTGSFYEDITQREYYVTDKWEFRQASDIIAHFDVQRVLDVGCGSGEFLAQLRAAAPDKELWGYDINPRAQEAISKHAHFIPDLDSVNKVFDCICIFQNIEHIADPFGLMERVTNLLRPGGALIITVPDYDGPVRIFPDSLTAIPPHHLTRWNEKSLRCLLELRGYSIQAFRREPLPDYLFDSYLPALASRLPVLRLRNRTRAFARTLGRALAHSLKAAGIRSLPLRGHTLFCLAEKRA